MKIADILRQLADQVDQEDVRDHNPVPELSATAGGDQVETPKNTDAGEDDETFVPPLQLKLELLKRAVGVDNVYDDERADEVNSESGQEDEIAVMQRRAGIVPVMMSVDDEPFDD